MRWTRETEWVQGALLTGQSLRELYSDAPAGAFAVVVSHSCDIANENLEVEPFVEFVLAQPIGECDPNLIGAKNPRKLHLRTLPKCPIGGLELQAHQKFNLRKIALQKHQPDHDQSLDKGEVQVLQSWLAARYRRQALPDSLQNRMKPLFKKMEKLGSKNAQGVIGYWFSYDPQGELPPTEPYEVRLSVVYSTEDPDFQTSASKIAKALEETTGLNGVDLSECSAYSDEEFTLKDLREQLQYRAEHLSFRTDPPGPIV